MPEIAPIVILIGPQQRGLNDQICNIASVTAHALQLRTVARHKPRSDGVTLHFNLFDDARRSSIRDVPHLRFGRPISPKILKMKFFDEPSFGADLHDCHRYVWSIRGEF